MLVPVRGGATRCQPVEPVTEAIVLALAERRCVTNTKELLTLHSMRATTSFLGPRQRSTTAWDVTLSLLTVSRLGGIFVPFKHKIDALPKNIALHETDRGLLVDLYKVAR